MGRLIDGWEAIATKKEMRDAYKNGIDSKVKLYALRDAKKMNKVADFRPMRIDKPTPILFLSESIQNSRKTIGFEV